MVELQAQLHSLAEGQMAREDSGHTLQATALVHEAYLRLVEQANLAHATREQFLAAAATTIRRILVDHARKRKAAKRGGAFERLTISHIEEPAAKARQLDLLLLDEALQRLALEDDRLRAVVECRVFSGMTVDEIAKAMGISPRTVADDWAFAKAWLGREMRR